VNNLNYGMTGGQFSPTTPMGAKASTARYGHIEPAFDIAALSATAGAGFVARTTVYHVTQMEKLLTQAIMHPGFSVLEVLSPCHTNYGRQNRLGSQVEMMKGYKKQAVRVERWEKMTAAEREGHFATGVLVDRELPLYLESYAKVCARARAQEGK